MSRKNWRRFARFKANEYRADLTFGSDVDQEDKQHEHKMRHKDTMAIDFFFLEPYYFPPGFRIGETLSRNSLPALTISRWQSYSITQLHPSTFD